MIFLSHISLLKFTSPLLPRPPSLSPSPYLYLCTYSFSLNSTWPMLTSPLSTLSHDLTSLFTTFCAYRYIAIYLSLPLLFSAPNCSVYVSPPCTSLPCTSPFSLPHTSSPPLSLCLSLSLHDLSVYHIIRLLPHLSTFPPTLYLCSLFLSSRTTLLHSH